MAGMAGRRLRNPTRMKSSRIARTRKIDGQRFSHWVTLPTRQLAERQAELVRDRQGRKARVVQVAPGRYDVFRGPQLKD